VKLEQENPWDASRSPPPLPALKAKLENRFYLFQKKITEIFSKTKCHWLQRSFHVLDKTRDYRIFCKGRKDAMIASLNLFNIINPKRIFKRSSR
jgi:hypothetical protein